MANYNLLFNYNFGVGSLITITIARDPVIMFKYNIYPNPVYMHIDVMHPVWGEPRCFKSRKT